MFTGIVERTARIHTTEDTGGGRRLVIEVSPDPKLDLPEWREVELGESIAIDGVCLTACEWTTTQGGGTVLFEAVPETLSKTTLGGLNSGDTINVERSLRVGDSYGGHYVTGHVDTVGQVRSRDAEGDQVLFRIDLEAKHLRQVIPKGSICVAGISLTVIDVNIAEGWFSFAAIPHTVERTTLREAAVGTKLNIETDAFGKWVLQGFDQLLGGEEAGDLIRRLGEERPS